MALNEGDANMAVFIRAANIADQRSAKYGKAWRRFGALANLLRSATKLERLLNQFWYNGIPPTIDLDDAYDALNHIAFFIRQAEQGQWMKDEGEDEDE